MSYKSLGLQFKYDNLLYSSH